MKHGVHVMMSAKCAHEATRGIVHLCIPSLAFEIPLLKYLAGHFLNMICLIPKLLWLHIGNVIMIFLEDLSS